MLVWLIFPIKFFLVFFAISLFLLSGSISSIFIKDEDKRRARYCKITGFYSGIVAFLIGVRKKIIDPNNLRNKVAGKNHLIVSNHLSYVDILLLASVYPALFITSNEVKETFFIGKMSELGGSFFIERRQISQIPKEIKKISKVLERGFDVVLFPEGTTGNGEKILPFKKSFLSCAVDAQVSVLPICINYKKINGKPLNKKNRDLVFWYGEMSFFPHLFKMILNVSTFKAEINFLPVIDLDKDESPKIARNNISTSAYKEISEKFENLLGTE